MDWHFLSECAKEVKRGLEIMVIAYIDTDNHKCMTILQPHVSEYVANCREHLHHQFANDNVIDDITYNVTPKVVRKKSQHKFLDVKTSQKINNTCSVFLLLS